MGGGILIYTTVDSPIGELLLLGDGEVLHGLYMQAGLKPIRVQPSWVRDNDAFAHVRAQLDESVVGSRTEFDLKLHLEGGAFLRPVWHPRTDNPYLETI